MYPYRIHFCTLYTCDNFTIIPTVRYSIRVVHLVRGCPHAPLCALKAIKQDLVRSPKQAAHIFAERDALKALAGCPFIVRLFDTFKDATHLYFLMECVGGGPLQRHFRGSLVILMLEYRSVVYRYIATRSVMYIVSLVNSVLIF